MASNDALFPQVKGFIEFDTLTAQAEQVVHESAARTWTDLADHDPGITLLQALAYNVSDIGYRLSLPLADLLTPAPERQSPGGGLFPESFGPQTALTCGPVSEEDYRRALLDLRLGDGAAGCFLFQNVQLIREPEPARYEYWYSPERRQYSFSKPTEGEPLRFTLRGNYELYVQPTREAQTHVAAAQAALDAFLRDNRNLGEAVSRVVWLQPQDIQVEAVIELDSDSAGRLSSAAMLAAIYEVIEAHVSPGVQRVSTAELRDRGWREEDIYEGPFLEHGWIPELPPALQQDDEVTVNLAPLVNQLLAIPGVKRIHALGTGQARSVSPWIWTGRPGRFPQLWGKHPLQVLAEGRVVRLMAHGMDCQASEEEIRSHLRPATVINNPRVTLPYGRWRNPAAYRTAGSRLPACYGLQNPRPTPRQRQLHQFLLPLEQLLANACKQIELLPHSLGFDREAGDVSRGAQWPFAQPSIGNTVFADVAGPLKALLERYSHDTEHELASVNFLLGYLGARVAPRIFSTPLPDFLASQQGYLRRLSELGYHRANVRIDRVSALQQRIAARLGWGGGAIFDENVRLDRLPFYLVEHRALLPVRPDPHFDDLQDAHAVRQEVVQGQACLTFGMAASSPGVLRVGQVLDLILTVQGTSQTLRGQMVEHVDPAAPSFSLGLAASEELQRLQDALLDPANTVHWQNCPYWLQDMSFPLAYAPDQTGLAADERRLTAAVNSSFPAFAHVGSRVCIAPLPAKRPARTAAASKPAAPAPKAVMTAEVTQVDSLANTWVLKRIGGGQFPAQPDASKYIWYFDPDNKTGIDNFSFVVSLVFDRDRLSQLTDDPYAAQEWIESVISEEVPAHICVVVHWLPSDRFRTFGLAYHAWQNNGAPLGDDAYTLLAMLTLGELPSPLQGIGKMLIATPEQKTLVVGPDGDQWNREVIAEEGLFYVPPKEET